MNEQQTFWAEDYTLEYIKKNSTFDAKLGLQAWGEMLKKAKDIGSILECGCNIGRNIGFLDKMLPSATKSVIEIGKPAFDLVTKRYKPWKAFNGSIEESQFDQTFDLVFTIAVLIHVHPKNLLGVMRKIYDHSNRYILIGEYFNRTPLMIEYQGQRDKLFKMDFGKMFLENFNVKVVDYGFLWGQVYDEAGFDDITFGFLRNHLLRFSTLMDFGNVEKIFVAWGELVCVMLSSDKFKKRSKLVAF